MKTLAVTDSAYSALEEAAKRSGRLVEDLVSEAIQAWLAEADMDEAEREEIESARAEAAEKGGVEFETFFAEILSERD